MSIQLSASNTLAFRMLLAGVHHLQSQSMGVADVKQVNFPLLALPFMDDRNISLSGRMTDGGKFLCNCKITKSDVGHWFPNEIRLALFAIGVSGHPYIQMVARVHEEYINKHHVLEFLYGSEGQRYSISYDDTARF